jgi:nucleotidyltransferase/DNA polymerase involved in DNA repair
VPGLRVACLLAPRLPVQVAQRDDPSLHQTPLVVGGRRWDDGAVLDCCPQAEAYGVHSGMRLARAEKLCPTAQFIPACETIYHATHHALTAAVKGLTPTLETADLGLLYAEVSGLQRFGTETELGQQIVRQACQSSSLCDVRIGIAGTKFSAHRAARAARPGGGCVVAPGDDRAYLAPLSLSTLPSDSEMQRRLQLLGVRTLGALAALPRPAVVRQFGPHAGPLHDLATGLDSRPVRPNAPPLQISRSRVFDDPLIDRAPLLAHTGRMAAELAGTLAQGGYQAEGLRLRLEEGSGTLHEKGIPVKPPSADAVKISRLAARLLGEFAATEPVAGLALTVYPLRPFHLGAMQLALWTPPQEKRSSQLRQVLCRLRERFGELIVVVASLVGAPPPRPVQVTTDLQGMPRAVVWRDHIREVKLVYETWRERRRWWSLPVERDYYRLETDDGLVRVVFREVRTDRWLLERRHI